jgi:hypothetical protein
MPSLPVANAREVIDRNPVAVREGNFPVNSLTMYLSGPEGRWLWNGYHVGVSLATPNLPPIAYTIAVSEEPKRRFAIALSDTGSSRW